MNDYNYYKKRNELEKKLFKYNDTDLINILVDNRDLIEEFYSCTPQEIKEKMKNINHEYLAELLLNNLFDREIDNALESLDKYEVKTIVKDNFPCKEPRELQLEAISKIYDAIENGYKFIIVEAVSGFGKSIIAATLSNIYSKDKSYILTTTDQLANQYVEDGKVKGLTKLNSRSTFRCKEMGDNCGPYKCKYTNCRFYNYSNFNNDFEKPLSCEYLYSLKEGFKSNSVICNYNFFIRENFYHSNYFKPRKLLICDEAHNIDEKISEYAALTVIYQQFEKDMGLDMLNEYEHIIQNEDYYYYLLKFKNIYRNTLKKKHKGSKSYIPLKKQLDEISKFMSYFNKSNENLAFDLDDEDKTWIFRPVKPNKIINDSLLKFGNICIFMSSSIFDHENFAFDLGIDENEIYSLRVPNVFDLSKNPIRIYPKIHMSGEPVETGAAKESLPIIERILKIHRSEKGVIHTSNYKQSQYIKNNIHDNRLITHDWDDREEILNNFKNSDKSLVLVSPSMDEGVDLPGDLCRFQIIFKLPYLPFEDPWVNKRKNLYEDSREWYDYKMLTKLIQGYGRGIRFEGDYCKTYILDNRLFDVINKDFEGNEIIPKYFINAIENFNPDI